MKKILFILVFTLVFLASCSNSGSLLETYVETEAPSPDPIEEVVVDDPYLGWATFEDEEMGIRFRYPSDLSVQTGSEGTLDIGIYRSVSIDDFSLVMTSEDYGVGIGEGCCFYYSGPPFDVNQNSDELEVELELGLRPPYDIRKISVGGADALRFDRVNGYVSYILVPSVLIPYDHGVFTNILISGPKLVEVSIYQEDGTQKDDPLAEFEAAVSRGQFDVDLSRFEMILASLEFL